MLLKKGYESLRIGFSGKVQKIQNEKIYELYKKLNAQKTIKEFEYTRENELIESASFQEIMYEIDSKLDFVQKFLLIYREIEKIVDNYIFSVEEIDLTDRLLFNYSYTDIEAKQKHRVIQVGYYKNNQSVFGIGFVKLDGMFFLIKQTNYDLDLIRRMISKFDGKYLNRVDFYFDFDYGDINQFLSENKIVGFQRNSILDGKNDLKLDNKSTYYWGKKKTKKMCVRLYDKRQDSLMKKKQKYYEYISPSTKRLEIEVESKKIAEYKTHFIGTIEQFIQYLYQEIVYHEYNQNNPKLKKYKMFQIYFLDENLKSISHTRKDKVKLDENIDLKISKFIEQGKRLKGALSKELFNAIVGKIYN